MRLAAAFAALGVAFLGSTQAQLYAGDYINTTLPGVPGSEIAFWKIQDGLKNNLTAIAYINHGSNGQRLDPLKIKRAVIIIHGNDRDPGTYESNMLSALAQAHATNSDVSTDSVAIVAPWFANGNDKTIFPWVNGLKANQGSITNLMVWTSSQWSAGGETQYPFKNAGYSSYTVLDQMVQYFDNTVRGLMGWTLHPV